MTGARSDVPLVELDGLHVELPVDGALRPVLHRVDLRLAAGGALGLVGESGSGKSMTLRSMMRLLPSAAQVSGAIRFDGRDVQAMSARELRALRSNEVAMVFQDPRAHINPVRSVGDFLAEGLVAAGRASRRDADRTTAALLRDVGVADADRRLRQHPHELSGGLLQRVMIAAALAVEPRLILADEPTTALDVTTQEEVMAILDEARRDRGLALVLVTHDLELASAVCDRTAVMYAGSIVEVGSSEALHHAAAHPYTVALLESRPELGEPGEVLKTIPGRPQSAFEVDTACSFAGRCARARDVCRTEAPRLRELRGGTVACHFAEDASAAGAAGPR